jgi:hypothetical protein
MQLLAKIEEGTTQAEPETPADEGVQIVQNQETDDSEQIPF